MALSVCPTVVVHSSAQRVWSILSNPEAYDAWWRVKTDSVVPPGSARAGQVIRAHGRAIGSVRKIEIRVVEVDSEKRELRLASHFPFGISLDNDLRVTPIDEGSARVSFG